MVEVQLALTLIVEDKFAAKTTVRGTSIADVPNGSHMGKPSSIALSVTIVKGSESGS